MVGKLGVRGRGGGGRNPRLDYRHSMKRLAEAASRVLRGLYTGKIIDEIIRPTIRVCLIVRGILKKIIERKKNSEK